MLAFTNNAAAFVQSAPVIMPLVIIHNALALATGFLFAQLLHLPLKDVKTITFETGVQNSGLGLVLIFTFFDGLGGMALVAATWGVWHLVTGGLLAGWWSKKSLS